jgi:tRNA U34 5-methylaminomethyl-2-thiouridine-forming methyltransferase MnmC
MHNPLGPWQETQELYIQPAELLQRLQATSSGRELVLYDVGLGAGFNAMGALIATLTAMASMDPKERRGFRILSFEKELALAHFSLKQSDQFPEFAPAWEALETLLNQGRWQHSEYPLTWELFPGDFLETLDQSLPTADLIFYDPYSPKRNLEMWSYGAFLKVREKCHADQESLLLTYSRATSVRSALLLAGFYVGHGRPIGLKEETTIASTIQQSLEDPLQLRWLERWRRSHSRFPADLLETNGKLITQWSEQIERHPQFASI